MKNIITSLLVLASLFSYAQNAALDPAFGNAGLSVYTYAYMSSIERFAFDNDGNIISTGYSSQFLGDDENRLTLTKTDSNGILDTTFGNNGVVYTEVEHSEYVQDIAIQPDGKIIVVGEAYSGPTPTGPGPRLAFAVRYNSDGSLDTSFADNGIYKLSSSRQFVSIMILPDNSIILGGNSYINYELLGILVKLDSNGIEDSQFGTNGILPLYSNDFQFYMWNSLLLSDGNIFCYGYDKSLGLPNPQSSYCKIDASGNFDTSFGTNGKVVIDIYDASPNIAELIHTARELPNGQIIMGGYEMDSFLAKINTDGSFDTTFGTNGLVHHSFPAKWSAMALQADGKIIVGGSKDMGNGNFGYSITRLDNNGSLDTTFNDGNGFVDIDASPENDYLQHLKLQSADKLIIGGSTSLNSNHHFTLARVLLNTPLSIEEPLEQNIKIYPNPFKEQFVIEDSEQIIEEIKIFDNAGRLIKVISNPTPLQEIHGDFSSGIYYINIKAKDGRIMNKKIIKK